MFSLCVSVHRGGGSYPTMHWESWTPPPPWPCPPPHPGPGPGPPTPAPAPPGPGPRPPQKKLTKKIDKKIDKKLTKKIDKKKWKLLEVGRAGGTPLAVTQEDCLVYALFSLLASTAYLLLYIFTIVSF